MKKILNYKKNTWFKDFYNVFLIVFGVYAFKNLRIFTSAYFLDNFVIILVPLVKNGKLRKNREKNKRPPSDFHVFVVVIFRLHFKVDIGVILGFGEIHDFRRLKRKESKNQI